ncbi:hypothetical protein ACROYT_G007171 [Oculina patagonica]
MRYRYGRRWKRVIRRRRGFYIRIGRRWKLWRLRGRRVKIGRKGRYRSVKRRLQIRVGLAWKRPKFYRDDGDTTGEESCEGKRKDDDEEEGDEEEGEEDDDEGDEEDEDEE